MSTYLWVIINQYPVIDVGLVIFWTGSTWLSWRGWSQSSNETKAEERQLAATVILSELNGVITGASVLMVGIGAFAVLIFGPNNLPVNSDIRSSLFYAALWAVMALLAALYTMATLPARTPEHSFVKSRSVAVITSAALVFPFIAGARFTVAIGLLLAP